MQDDKKAHQITLQELGIIPKEPKRKEEVRKQYAFPCGGCVCSHCANNVETPDTCTGEMKEPCVLGRNNITGGKRNGKALCSRQRNA